ncbi:MAG: exodeoxyribonuclease VII large subunit, partial [bacterium]
RYPPIDLYLIPVSVQGDTAADEISNAIDFYNELGIVDIIVVGRGGGSLEDLWAFNEEVVVRAVANSRIPVVSAVGHEVDVTLCDLAADLRAPTPASAGNVVLPDKQELLESLKSLGHRLNQALTRTVALWRERITHIAQGYGFKRLSLRIGEERRRLDDLAERMGMALTQTILRKREWLNLQSQRLSALSPLAVLERGYCLARKEDHALVRQARELAIGEKIFLHFAHDRAKVLVEKVMV